MGFAYPSFLFLRGLTIFSSVLDGWRFGKRNFTLNLLPYGIVDTPSLILNKLSFNPVLKYNCLRLGTILTYYSIILKLKPLYLHSFLFFIHLHKLPLYFPFLETANSASFNDEYTTPVSKLITFLFLTSDLV